MSRKALFKFVFFPVVFRPARALSYRTVALKDTIALVAYINVIVPVAGYLNHLVHGHPSYSAALSELSLPLRFVVYLVAADFGHYWIHRLVHTRYLWRVHKWHHSPTYMYWLGGVRATVPQQFLVNIPYILAYPLLLPVPWWMAIGLGAFFAAQNDWMHMNCTWRSRWLEWLVVTPRYHHIHHSADPQHYEANMGNMFTIWDRLFGTHVAPDTVAPDFPFGLGTRENPVRLVLGV